MITSNQQSGKKKQNGLVLLVMVIVIFLAISSYYFSSISIVDFKVGNEHITHKSLKRAKQALLDYTTLRSDVKKPSLQPGKYGYLPCPANTNGDGNSVGSCGDANKNYLGWFPWRSLGLPPLKDGNGDCLLYAVSSTYKYNPVAGMLNEDTNFGMFQVVDGNNNNIHGSSAQNRAVAIVFSAGTVLAGQNRVKDPAAECGDDADNFDAYLDAFEVSPGDVVDNSDVENINTDRVDRFVQAASAENKNIFNDQLIVITRDEIWPRAIQHREKEFDIADISGASKVRRLTEALARCLASYANDNDNSSLPFPAPIDFSGGDYRDDAAYDDDDSLYVGRYPYITDSSDLIIPGTVVNDELFTKVFNGPISLVTGIWQCDALLIESPASSLSANLNASTSEDRRLWNNWKDRIIYAVSERYVARGAPTDDLVQPRCNDPVLVGSNKCINYNGTEYAAIIMYAGERLVNVQTSPGVFLTQVRDSPVAFEDFGVVVDSKADSGNYIEIKDPASSWPGVGDFNFIPEAYSNDLFFCLTDTEPVDVIECI